MKRNVVLAISVLLLAVNLTVTAQCNFTGNFLNPAYNCTTNQATVTLRICSSTLPSGEKKLVGTVNGVTVTYYGTVGGAIGTCPYSVRWTNVPVGNYTLKIGTTLCTAYTVAVTKPVSGTITITPSRSPFLCQGEPITLTASGGSNYSWSASSGGSWTGSQITVSPSSNTTYTLTGTKSGTCGGTGSDNLLVSVTPTVGQVSTPSGTTLRCQGSGTDSYTASASNAGGGYSWAIASGEAVSPGTISTSGVVTWNSSFSGVATVRVTAYGCNGSSSTTTRSVTVNALPTAFNLYASSPICAGTSGTVTLNGSQLNVSYQLYKNNSPLGGSVGGTESPIQWTGMTEGTYKVIASLTGCATVEMTNQPTIGTTSPGSIYITASRSPLLCQGETITLTANGGTNYTWSSNMGGSWAGSSITVAPSVTTSYTLSGNENTCNTPKTANLEVNVTPVVGQVVNFLGTVSRCQGSGTDPYTATASNAGGGYSWAITSGEAVSPGTISTSGVVTWNSSFSGVATVRVTAYGCNGSSSTASKNVTVGFIATAYNISAASEICSGATATVTLTGSQSTVSYQLYRNDLEVGGTVDGTDSPIQWTGMTQGTYKVVAFPNYCPSREMANQKTIATRSPGVIEITESTPPFLCDGDPITLTASGGSNYGWSASTGGTWVGSSITVSPSITTTYTLSGTESICSTLKTAEIEVNVKPVPFAYITPSGQRIIYSFESQEIHASTGEGYSYEWFKDNVSLPGETASNYWAGTSGNYKVNITLNGCPKMSGVLDLRVNSKPLANAGPDQVVVLPDRTITLGGSGSDADGIVTSYQWTQSSGPPVSMTGVNTASLTVQDLVLGTYEFCLLVADDLPEDSDPNCAMVTVNAPPNNYNRMTETTILVKDIKSEAQIDPLMILSAEKNVQINYLDGLGRPMQTVTMRGSPLGNDIVQPSTYDQYGRQANLHLPVTLAKTDGFYTANGDIIDATTKDYTGIAADFYTDSRPFTENIFDHSPMNRQMDTYGPGEEWKSKNKHTSYQYLSNVHGISPTAALPAEKIVAWTINNSGLPVRSSAVTGYILQGGYYDSGQLKIKSAKDENGNETREYIDKSGRLILKKVQVKPITSLNDNTQWALTYYIYDSFGNTRFILQPVLCATILESDSYNPLLSELNKLAFQYKYDGRKRIVEKKIPGAEPVFMVYDKLNRLVMTQDGNLRKTPANVDKKQWMFIKYDRLNRPVMTGVYTHSTVADQATMAAEISTENLYETYVGDPLNHGYTDVVFPSSTSSHILTVTYYDNYDFVFDLAGESNYRYQLNDLTGQEGEENDNVLGVMTGSKTTILQPILNLSVDYLWNVQYYDNKYRIIQTKSQNHKGGIDRKTNLYDFVKLKEAKASHETLTPSSSSAYSAHRMFDYDHLGRLRKVYHKFHTEPVYVVLQDNFYNEKGELEARRVHSRDNGNTFGQSTRYSYNVRGWLEKINDPAHPMPGDLFNLELRYNQPSVKGGQAQFNGNISELIWSSPGIDKQSYAYGYDEMNRLLEARHYNLNNPLKDGRYTEKIGDPQATPVRPAYDLNGNIKNLIRYGKTQETADASEYGIIDDLVYTYVGLDNILTHINDSKPDSDFDDGFKDKDLSATEYRYDWNGNITSDDNKGVTVEYNCINLPSKVEKGTSIIEYTYDASGKKLAQKVYGGTNKITQYIGDHQYEQVNEDQPLVLQFVGTEEGRIIPENSPGATRPWTYQYFLKDHLGNTRIVFSENHSMMEYKADFEAEDNAHFRNYSNAGIMNEYDHSDIPGSNFTRSQVLNAGYAGKVGAAKSLEVNAGDILDLEVYAKYENPTCQPDDLNCNVQLAELITDLVATFNLGSTSAGLESNQAETAFEDLFVPTYVGEAVDYEDALAPKAYLNYILFDENFTLIDFGFDQINVQAKQNLTDPWIDHDRLNLHVKVHQKGFLYVFLSNENPTELRVYFDDFKIIHHTNIEQVADYYAFGLKQQSSGFEKDEDPRNLYLYSGKELQDEMNLNWLDYGARMYMPEIGRWTMVDPLTDISSRWSPYSYVFDNPIKYVDPDGMRTRLIQGLDGRMHEITDDDVITVYTADDQSNPCESCIPGAAIAITEISKNDDGSYTFTENLIVQEDLIDRTEIINAESQVERRRFVVTETTTITTLDSDGDIVQSTTTGKQTTSRYSHYSRMRSVGGGRITIDESWGVPKNNISVKEFSFSDSEHVGLFGSIARLSLKTHGQFPLRDDFQWVNYTDDPLLYQTPDFAQYGGSGAVWLGRRISGLGNKWDAATSKHGLHEDGLWKVPALLQMLKESLQKTMIKQGKK